MPTKPFLIKLRTIETLLDTVLNGNIYKQAVMPLLHGVIQSVTSNTVTIEHLGDIFKIRCDQPIHTNMESFKQLLLDQVNAYVRGGANLIKDLTDINSLAGALTTENTFSRNGVTMTVRKVSEATEDGIPAIYEYKIKTEHLNKQLTTTNEDEVLTFLGSLARHYTIARQSPDANWYRNTEQPKRIKTGGRRVALPGGRRSMGAALVNALNVTGSSIEAKE